MITLNILLPLLLVSLHHDVCAQTYPFTCTCTWFGTASCTSFVVSGCSSYVTGDSKSSCDDSTAVCSGTPYGFTCATADEECISLCGSVTSFNYTYNVECSVPTTTPTTTGTTTRTTTTTTTAPVCDSTVLSACSLTSCPGATCDVDCTNQGLEKWPCASSLPSSIYILWLDNNGFSVLPNDMFKGKVNFVDGFLFLSSNLISSIASGAFSNLVGLSSLVLASNSLSFLGPNVFSGLTLTGSLAYLVLTDNPITSIASGAFNGVDGLTILSLNDLPPGVSIQSGAFSGLSNMQILYLNNNQNMTISSGAFSGVNKLANGSFSCGSDGSEECTISACPTKCGSNSLCTVVGNWSPQSNITCSNPSSGADHNAAIIGGAVGGGVVAIVLVIVVIKLVIGRSASYQKLSG